MIEFNYIESTVSTDGEMEVKMSHRLIERARIRSLGYLWRNSDMSTVTKAWMLDGITTPSMLCSPESRMSNTKKKRMEVFDVKC